MSDDRRWFAVAAVDNDDKVHLAFRLARDDRHAECLYNNDYPDQDVEEVKPVPTTYYLGEQSA